jgi:hypothetical protein
MAQSIVSLWSGARAVLIVAMSKCECLRHLWATFDVTWLAPPQANVDNAFAGLRASCRRMSSTQHSSLGCRTAVLDVYRGDIIRLASKRCATFEFIGASTTALSLCCPGQNRLHLLA